jgi:hypothetical protein
MKDKDIVICRRKDFLEKSHSKLYIDLEIGEYYIIRKVDSEHGFYKPEVIVQLYGKSNFYLDSNFEVLNFSEIRKIHSGDVFHNTRNHAIVTILSYLKEYPSLVNVIEKELNYFRYHDIINDINYASVIELKRIIKKIEDDCFTKEVTDLFNQIMDCE